MGIIGLNYSAIMNVQGTAHQYWVSICLSLLVVIVTCLPSTLLTTAAAVEEYDLPIFPPELYKNVSAKAGKLISKNNKYIPQDCWIAVRNISDIRPAHWIGPKGFPARNKHWTIHFQDNDMKDEFMATNFAGTSFLWAYNILNPLIGCAKVELWRLAVLWMHGGMYMDDDANIATPLDEVVTATDKFIAGREVYDWDDQCFKETFPLSNHSFNLRYGDKNKERIFDNKYFFNWALFSMPGNILLERVITHIVHLLKGEYLGPKYSQIHHKHSDPGKTLMCASTFPITLAARELVLEGKQSEMGIRVGGAGFAEYGANMKAWNNDYLPTRWTKMMNNKRVPYLREYAPPKPSDFDGQLVQGQGHREIYLVKDGHRLSFPDFTTFVAMGFDLENVEKIKHTTLEIIPLGKSLPHMDEKKS